MIFLVIVIFSLNITAAFCTEINSHFFASTILESQIRVNNWILPVVVWGSFALALSVVIFINNGNKWRHSCPLYSAPLQIKWGLNDLDIWNEVRKRYPNSHIDSIRRGKLYGIGIVNYNFKRFSFKNLRNQIFGHAFNGQDAYSVRLFLLRKETTVYILKKSGNEVTVNSNYCLTFDRDEENSEIKDPVAKKNKIRKCQIHGFLVVNDLVFLEVKNKSKKRKKNK